MIKLEPKIYSFEQLLELNPDIGTWFFVPTKEDLEIGLKKGCGLNEFIYIYNKIIIC